MSGHKPKGLHRVEVYGLGLVFGLVTALYLLAINPDVYFSFWPDQTTYLVYALAFSRGLGDTCIALASGLPTTIMHPPGFAFLLSLVIRIFGFHVPLMKLVLILIYLFGLLLYADSKGQSRDPYGFGPWAAVLTASAPFALAYSQLVLADLPYLGLSLAALWVYERGQPPRGNYFWLGGSALLAIAAFYLRAIGLAVIAALLLALLLDFKKNHHRSRRPIALLISGVLLAGLGSWFIYNTLRYHGGGWTLYFEEMSAKSVGFSSAPESIQPWKIIVSRLQNLHTYETILGQLLCPWMRDPATAWLPGILVSGLAAGGLISSLKKDRSCQESYFLFYSLVLLLWAHPEQRYLLPIYPQLFYYQLRGIAVIGDRLKPRLGHWLPPITALLVLGAHLYLDLSQVVSLAPAPVLQNRFRLRPQSSAPWLEKVGSLPSIPISAHFRMLPSNQQGADLIRLELWARDHLPRDSKIVANYVNDCYLISGLQNPFFYDQGSDPLEAMERGRVDYVIVAEAQPFISSWVMPAIIAQPDRFQKIAWVPGTRTVIYKFSRVKAGPDGH